MKPVTIAIIGTGFVADYYITTLANHTSLVLAGAWDRDAARLAQFCAFHKVTAYQSLEAVLSDPSVEIICNLTTPESHYDISKAILDAKKHVYSEKPLAMELANAEALVELATDKRLTIAAAPANGLSDAYSLVASQLATNVIGNPRLIYAEMEDGPVFREKWQTWKSRSGAVWPGVHEFEIGCTLEHAGYALSWLVGLFGEVEEVTSFSALTFPNKGEGTDRLHLGADFSVGCLRFKSGVIARLTSGLAAPRDRSLTILGDKGSITVRDLWDNQSVIHLEQTHASRPLLQRILRKLEAKFNKALPFKLIPGHKLKYASTKSALPSYPSQIDFMAGVAAQAEMIRGGKSAKYAGQVALHITEIALALHAGTTLAPPYKVRNSF